MFIKKRNFFLQKLSLITHFFSICPFELSIAYLVEGGEVECLVAYSGCSAELSSEEDAGASPNNDKGMSVRMMNAWVNALLILPQRMMASSEVRQLPTETLK